MKKRKKGKKNKNGKNPKNITIRSRSPPFLEGLRWTKIHPKSKSTLPPSRAFQSICENMKKQEFYIIGGDNKKQFFKDAMVFNVPKKSWRKISSMKKERTGHSSVFFQGCIYVFGGRSRNNNYLCDLQRYSFDEKSWKTVVPERSVRPRGAHTANVIGHRMFVFGGIAKNNKYASAMEYLNTILVFDFEEQNWKKERIDGQIPDQRAGHCCCVVKERYLYVFGGRKGSLLFNDLFYLDSKTLLWTFVKGTGDIPQTRAGHSLCCYLDRYLILWSGSNWGKCFGDVYVFDLETFEWSRKNTFGDIPIPRFFHSGCVLNASKQMFVFGGGNVDKGMMFNDIHSLDLSSLSPESSPYSSFHEKKKEHKNKKNEENENENEKNSNRRYQSSSKRNRHINNRKYWKHKRNKRKKETIINESPTSPQDLRIKVEYEGIVSVFRVPPTLFFFDLVDRFKESFRLDELSISYADEEDPEILVRSDEGLKECFEYFEEIHKPPRLKVIPSLSTLSVKAKKKEEEDRRREKERELRDEYFPDRLNRARQLSQWQRGRKIGEGGYGIVYLGINVATSEFMAVKQVNIKGMEPKRIREVMQEIELMKELSHRNIVRYFGTSKDEDHLYIFMEYVSGGSVRKVIEHFNNRLAENTVRDFTRHMLMGLSYLHSRDIIHRDLKSANLLVDPRGGAGIVKLADFGNSRKLSIHHDTKHSAGYDEEEFDEIRHSKKKRKKREGGTAVGEILGICGTCHWMAPEVILSSRRKEIGKPSDIWSLGCTVIEMLSGKHPWAGQLDQCENEYAVMFSIAHRDDVPTIRHNICSEDAKNFLGLCLRRDPQSRATVDELLKHRFVTQRLSEEETMALFDNSENGQMESSGTRRNEDDHKKTSKTRKMTMTKGGRKEKSTTTIVELKTEKKDSPQKSFGNDAAADGSDELLVDFDEDNAEEASFDFCSIETYNTMSEQEEEKEEEVTADLVSKDEKFKSLKEAIQNVSDFEEEEEEEEEGEIDDEEEGEYTETEEEEEEEEEGEEYEEDDIDYFNEDTVNSLMEQVEQIQKNHQNKERMEMEKRKKQRKKDEEMLRTLGVERTISSSSLDEEENDEKRRRGRNSQQHHNYNRNISSRDIANYMKKKSIL